MYYNARYHDQSAPDKSPHIKQQLPDFLLSSAGIAFRFFKEDMSDAGQPHITHSKPIVIPYAGLAPYVQPGTPLARLVAARARPGR